MVGEYKTLGELVESDPALKGRVVVAKVSTCAGRHNTPAQAAYVASALVFMQ